MVANFETPFGAIALLCCIASLHVIAFHCIAVHVIALHVTALHLLAWHVIACQQSLHRM